MQDMGEPQSRRFQSWRADEIELLQGAIEENETGTRQAIADCAYLMGRSVESVAKQAQFLRRDARKMAAVAKFMPRASPKPLITMPRPILDVVLPTPSAKPIPYVSSFIRKLTPQELMCGRVSRRSVAA